MIKGVEKWAARDFIFFPTKPSMFSFALHVSAFFTPVTTTISSQSGLVSIFSKFSVYSGIQFLNTVCPFSVYKQITKIKVGNLTDERDVTNQRNKFDDPWKRRREVNRNECDDRHRRRNRSRGRIRGRKRGGGVGGEGCRR